jgi:hypothetical protein
LCWFLSTHSGASSAYTLAYPAALTIVHLDGTSILSLYNIKEIIAYGGDNLYKEGRKKGQSKARIY